VPQRSSNRQSRRRQLQSVEYVYLTDRLNPLKWKNKQKLPVSSSGINLVKESSLVAPVAISDAIENGSTAESIRNPNHSVQAAAVVCCSTGAMKAVLRCT